MENEFELVAVPVTATVVRRQERCSVTITIDRKQGNFFMWCPKGTHDRNVSGHTLTLEPEDLITVSRTEQHPQDALTVLQLIRQYPMKEV